MKMILCDNGHWYDADAYAACPYCETRNSSATPVPITGSSDRTWTERRDVPLGAPPRRVPVSLVPSRLPEPWDDCHVTDKLGSGGAGTVFRIRRTVDYALKVVSWSTEDAREMALREYETARKLADCGHILQYLDYGEADSSSLLFQELATPWMSHARQQTCTVGEVLDAVLQLCKALSAMEAAGILHMDVNPKNIFVRDGRVKLGDFSHARSLAPGEKYTRLVGTAPFMAPEIVCGGVCSGREDIYSLGITMYLLLTGGRFPFRFEGRDPMVRRASDRIATVFLDGELKRIVEKAAAFAPEERYDSASAMADDVAAFMSAHLEDLAEPTPRPTGGGVRGSGDDWEHQSTERTLGSMPDWNRKAPFAPPGRDAPGGPGDPELPLDYFSVASYIPSSNGSAVMPPAASGDEPGASGALPAPEKPRAEAPRMEEVRFTAVAEAAAERDDYGIVEIAMYTPAHETAVLERIRQEFTGSTREVSSHGLRVSEDAEVTVRLTAKGAELEENEVTYRWNGSFLIFSFDFHVPEDLRQQRILFRAEVFIGGFAATTLRFTVDVEGGALSPAKEVSRRDVKSAFLSYAREDMLAVTYILQALRKARPDLDLFFDLENLRSGEHWEERLYEEIRKRDCLFLCWSRHAALSEWVKREWQYMAEDKGIEAIEPIPLESPEDCPVPEKLKDLHFNDIETLIRKAARLKE